MNFSLNLKTKLTPALLALALLTTNVWAMDSKEPCSKEESDSRAQQRAKEERAYAQRIASAAQVKHDAELAKHLQETLGTPSYTYSSNSSSASTFSATPMGISSSSSSTNTASTSSSSMTVTALDVNDNGSGSLDVDEKGTITPVATVTLTAADKTSRQVPLNRFSVSVLYEIAQRLNIDGVTGWIKDMQRPPSPLSFPSAAALNAFCNALETIYQAQQNTCENKDTQRAETEY